MYYIIRIVLVPAVYALIFFALVKSKKLVFFTKKRNPELYKKEELIPISREITPEQAVYIAQRQGYKVMAV